MSRVPSAESFEVPGGFGQFECHPAQLVGVGAVVGRGHHVLGGAAQLEQTILKRGQLAVGQHDGVLGQAAALHGEPALVARWRQDWPQ